MILPLLRRFFNRKFASTNPRLNQFRPGFLLLEDRVTPATSIWGGNGMGNGALWSVAANWSNGVPGANDTAIFDRTLGVGANTDCTMDMGGVGSYHVGKLVFRNDYTKTLTLNTELYVDVLEMQSAATITVGAGAHAAGSWLNLTQEAGHPTRPQATIFATSKWTQGTIATAGLKLLGEDAHRTTLVVGDNTSTTMNLKTEVIIAEYTTLEWKDGNVAVEKGTIVHNFGTFLADSPGKTMGNDGAAADKWTFENRKDLNLGKGKFKNVEMKKVGPDAREFKISSASSGTDLFEIVGTYTHDVAGTSISVQSGTLSIDGDFTQSDGSVTVAAGTSLAATGVFALDGGHSPSNSVPFTVKS